MWHRIKKNAKSQHDKKYKAACAKTGGGIGPEQPKNKYVYEVEIDLHDLDPTNTKFDSLIRPDLRRAQNSSPCRGLSRFARENVRSAHILYDYHHL